MTDKYVMIDISDERTVHVADALTNKTCKKILGVLAEHELSESELASELGQPMNTIGYNVKKLVKAGLIEQSSSLWSLKGKRVSVYRLSNKKIIISPKTTFRGIVPAVIISGIAAFFIKLYTNYRFSMAQTGAGLLGKSEAAGGGASSGIAATSAGDVGVSAWGVYGFLAGASNTWAWFFIGALTGLAIFMLWNFLRKR